MQMSRRAAIAVLVVAGCLLGATPLGGVLTQVIADTLYIPKAGGGVITAAHAVTHLGIRMTGDSTGLLDIKDFTYNSAPTTLSPALEARPGHANNAALSFLGRAGDGLAAVPVFQFLAANGVVSGAPSTNALLGIDSYATRKFTVDNTGQLHLGDGTGAITDKLQVDGDVRLSTGMVRQHVYVNPVGSSGCNEATEAGTIRFVNPAADAGYRACQCICTRTAVGTYGWATISLNGACTASTDC